MFDDEKVWFDYSLNPRWCLPATTRSGEENLSDRSANDARDPITPATTATSLLGDSQIAWSIYFIRSRWRSRHIHPAANYVMLLISPCDGQNNNEGTGFQVANTLLIHTRASTGAQQIIPLNLKAITGRCHMSGSITAVGARFGLALKPCFPIAINSKLNNFKSGFLLSDQKQFPTC